MDNTQLGRLEGTPGEEESQQIQDMISGGMNITHLELAIGRCHQVVELLPEENVLLRNVPEDEADLRGRGGVRRRNDE